MNKQRVLQVMEYVKGAPETMDYGKWGALNPEQRHFIAYLCESWLILDGATNLQTKEIERLNNIINEQDKELELERKSRQLLTDDLANICEMSLKKENIIKEVREYIASFNLLKDLGALEKDPISISELKHILELLNIGADDEEN